MPSLPTPEALLFDLDGTLVDTAPDLARATNALRAITGCRSALSSDPLPGVQWRQCLVTLALGFEKDHPDHAAARDFLLARYGEAVAWKATFFHP